MKMFDVWMVFRASDQSVRTVKRAPGLAWDEVAWRVRVRIPDPWGRTVGAFEVTLPEEPPAGVTVTAIEQPSDKAGEAS